MKQTRWFGSDCLGNTPHAVTVEGTCIQDIYEPAGWNFYNQETGQTGIVEEGDDGELHFYTPDEHAEALKEAVSQFGQSRLTDADVAFLRRYEWWKKAQETV
jgi:hypothetical protein